MLLLNTCDLPPSFKKMLSSRSCVLTPCLLLLVVASLSQSSQAANIIAEEYHRSSTCSSSAKVVGQVADLCVNGVIAVDNPDQYQVQKFELNDDLCQGTPTDTPPREYGICFDENPAGQNNLDYLQFRRFRSWSRLEDDLFDGSYAVLDVFAGTTCSGDVTSRVYYPIGNLEGCYSSERAIYNVQTNQVNVSSYLDGTPCYESNLLVFTVVDVGACEPAKDGSDASFSMEIRKFDYNARDALRNAADDSKNWIEDNLNWIIPVAAVLGASCICCICYAAGWLHGLAALLLGCCDGTSKAEDTDSDEKGMEEGVEVPYEEASSSVPKKVLSTEEVHQSMPDGSTKVTTTTKFSDGSMQIEERITAAASAE